jgi:hypothetical protein
MSEKTTVIRCDAIMGEEEADAFMEFLYLTGRKGSRGHYAGVTLVKAMDRELTQTGLKLPCGYVPKVTS